MRRILCGYAGKLELFSSFVNRLAGEYAGFQTIQWSARMSAMRQAVASFLPSGASLFLALGVFFFCGSYARAASSFSDVAPSSEQPITIPLEYAHGHLFLQLALDGSGMHTIMLDTGFTSESKIIMIDTPIADRLRMGRGERLQIAGLGVDNIPGRKIDDIDIHLGETVVAHSTAESFDFTFLRAALHHPVDGIIGFAFLRDYVAEIDFPNRVLRLYDPARYRYHGDGIQIPMDKLRPVIRAEVQLPTGEQREAQLLIDTGSDAVLLLDPHFVNRRGRLLRSANVPKSSYIGLGGRYACDVVRLSKIQLGTNLLGRQVWIPSFYADLAPIRASVSASRHLDGDMGNTLLDRMDMIFDPARSRLILEITPLKIALNSAPSGR